MSAAAWNGFGEACGGAVTDYSTTGGRHIPMSGPRIMPHSVLESCLAWLGLKRDTEDLANGWAPVRWPPAPKPGVVITEQRGVTVRGGKSGIWSRLGSARSRDPPATKRGV